MEYCGVRIVGTAVEFHVRYDIEPFRHIALRYSMLDSRIQYQRKYTFHIRIGDLVERTAVGYFFRYITALYLYQRGFSENVIKWFLKAPLFLSAKYMPSDMATDAGIGVP